MFQNNNLNTSFCFLAEKLIMYIKAIYNQPNIKVTNNEKYIEKAEEY